MILLFVREEDGVISLCLKRDNEPFVAVPVTAEKATALAHQLLGAALRVKGATTLAHEFEAGVPTG